MSTTKLAKNRKSNTIQHIKKEHNDTVTSNTEWIQSPKEHEMNNARDELSHKDAHDMTEDNESTNDQIKDNQSNNPFKIGSEC